MPRKIPAMINGELTPQQSAVLTMVAEGKTHPEIARELWLSIETVRFHCKMAYRSIGAVNGPNAVAIALRKGLIK